MKKVLIAFVVIISMTQPSVTSPFCDTDTAIAQLLSLIESPDATNQIGKHKILCFDRIFAILLHPRRQAAVVCVLIRYIITKNQFKSAILQVNVCYFGNFQIKIE